jgi:hypothetical protein
MTLPASPNTSAAVLKLIEELVQAARLAGSSLDVADVSHELTGVPHRRPSRFPKDSVAIYTFHHRQQCLKVGKAGARSKDRFLYQHYGMNANSTLAKSLLAAGDRIGVTGLAQDNVGRWIEENTWRLDLWVPATHGPEVLNFLEAFLICKLRPVFEGFDAQRISVAR